MNSRALRSRIFGQSILCLLLVYFDFQLLSSPRPWIFPDYANLAIHEGGHLVFSFFGMFIYILGGSLFQCLVPLVFSVYFYYQRALFSSFFCIFWLGDNLINVSVYIKDSRSMTLPLFGGEGSIHDWHWLLDNTNLLAYDQVIGGIVFFFGALCAIVGTVLAIGWTVKQIGSFSPK